MARPKVGVFGLTGCAGDQLVILDCEDELLKLVEILDIRAFLLASSEKDEGVRLDLALVEGAVLSLRDEERLRAIRQRSDVLVALGTCAMYGGIPVTDRDHDRAILLRQVYGEAGDGYDPRPARALHEVVRVDLGIPGCPIEKDEFLDAIASLLRGDPPLGHDQPVCVECRLREGRCLFTVPGGWCLGPVTAGGCHARCPPLGIGCVGCRGPAVDANVPSLLALFERRGMPRAEARRKLRTFAAVQVDGERRP